jgi:hypothetical protein
MRTTLPRSGLLLAALGFIAVVSSARCANVDRGLGEACLRDEDCLSGVCAGQVCVSAPPVLSTLPTTDAAAMVDGAAHDSQAPDSGTDAPSAMDAGALDSGSPEDGSSPKDGAAHHSG